MSLCELFQLIYLRKPGDCESWERFENVLSFFWDQIWVVSKANLTQIKFSRLNQNWVGAKRGSLLPWPHLQVMNLDWKWTAILLKITIFIFNKVCKCDKDLVHQDLNNYWKV